MIEKIMKKVKAIVHKCRKRNTIYIYGKGRLGSGGMIAFMNY